MLSAVLLSLLHVCLTLGQLNDKITIDRLHIRSDIRHRFAETVVTSTITNNAGFAQDVTFDVRLPNEAFISNYTMLVDGVMYPGRVEEKGAGNRRFQAAVRRGESAGKVAVTSAREANDFTVTVNVAAVSHVTFNLTYQELLQRTMGLYEHVIYINPGEVIPDFRLVVYINESREITDLSVPEIRGDSLSSGVISGNNRFAQIRSVSLNEAEIVFAPTPDQQREYSPQGVVGQFIVNYDVDRTSDPDGEILVTDGYFVHFYAPDNLPPMGKRIMFVLDVSGSMRGRKIQQLIEALKFILGELRPQDEFGILPFSSGVRFWGSGRMVNGTHQNIERAKTYANSIRANGGTNINAALLKGLEQLSYHVTKPSMILFLTDGQATVGVTRSARILENVRSARHNRQSIYSLAFGKGADFGLMQKISAQNGGLARKIFEDADAALQLAGFYNEISSPLLSEVAISYLGGLVNDSGLTRSAFTTFFSGSEIVVAGSYENPGQSSSSLTVVVEGSQASSYVFHRRRYCICPGYYYYYLRYYVCLYGRCDICPYYGPYRYWYHPPVWPCPPPPPPPPTLPPPPPKPERRPTTFIERLWVYLTIKQLIGQELEEQSPSSTVAKQAKAKALKLSLKYNFVTPYTTMVATRPNNVKVSNSFGPAETAPAAAAAKQPVPVPQPQPPAVPPPSRGRFPIPGGIAGKGSAALFGPAPGCAGCAGGRSPAFRLFPTFPTIPIIPIPTTTPFPTSSPANSGLPSGLNIQLNITSLDPQDEFICLDIVSTASIADASVLLLNDTENDLAMTGKLQSREYNGVRKFAAVSVITSGTELIEVSVKSVVIRGNVYRWWQLSSLNEPDVTVTAFGGVELTTAENVSLTFHKHGIETRRSLSSPFIVVSVRNTDNLSAQATGNIGAILELSDIQLGVDNRLHVMKNGVQRDFPATADKLRDGTRCQRITDQSDLTELLGL